MYLVPTRVGVNRQTIQPGWAQAPFPTRVGVNRNNVSSHTTQTPDLKGYSASGNPLPFVEIVGELFESQGQMLSASAKSIARISPDDLHLVCYEYICS